ncbi:hypothetical protein L596_023203 [Steinernema carpocapsae]|uniref:SXP/RAL-2 family protein Ani s 5-like cation-binding domain-containing protein n=1 Tax=Steinernema carpocapsae TaxID=34508 RepID=A0A4V5ZZC3_STECR|nr:hypothetical protein L596_023203 [Steinernema carpocapsae]
MKLSIVALFVLIVAIHSRPNPDENDDFQEDLDDNIALAAAQGGDIVDNIMNNLPPEIADAVNNFSDQGKAAVARIVAAAKSDEASDTPFDIDQFMTMLMDASPSDFAALVAASDKLDQDIQSLSDAAKNVYNMGKNVWSPGHAISEQEFQEFATAIQALSDDDRQAYFKLFPSAAQFYNSNTFQKALSGTLEFDETV